MKITPINNQRNNKPAFGMAVKRVNTAGMTNLEKQAVSEWLPVLKSLFKKIDGEIMMDISPVYGRQFKVFASDPRDANKKVYEAVSNGIYCHPGDEVGLRNLKSELFSNAKASIATYLAKNKEIAKTNELDNAIAHGLLSDSEIKMI